MDQLTLAAESTDLKAGLHQLKIQLSLFCIQLANLIQDMLFKLLMFLPPLHATLLNHVQALCILALIPSAA